jgi:hypothetical protein
LSETVDDSVVVIVVVVVVVVVIMVAPKSGRHLHWYEIQYYREIQYQDQEINDQSKGYMDPEWHEAMVDAYIGNLEMSSEESVSYFKCLENLEKSKHTNGSIPALLSLENKKRVSDTSSVGKASKNSKG